MRYNLSDIKGLIADRRSIPPELYSPRKVSREIVAELLDSARWAPTHRFTQPWHFKVYMGDATAKLGDLMGRIYRESALAGQFSQERYEKISERPGLASAVICICMRRDPEERDPECEEIASVAMAVQNMMLVAAAHGIGSFWSTGGVTYHPLMSEAMGLGAHSRFLGLLYLGYPKDPWPRPTRRRPVEYFTEWNT